MSGVTDAPVAGLADRARAQLAARSRWRVAEIVFWAAVAACYFVFPSRHALLNDMAILALFALSLDLILGFAGILSLGHAAFFGLGAYLAGIITKYGITDPIAGLVLAALAARAAGIRDELPRAARLGPDAADGDPRGQPRDAGDREPAALADRWRGRAAGHQCGQGVRHLGVRSRRAMSPPRTA